VLVGVTVGVDVLAGVAVGVDVLVGVLVGVGGGAKNVQAAIPRTSPMNSKSNAVARTVVFIFSPHLKICNAK
jgi:hypothetical protein